MKGLIKNIRKQNQKVNFKFKKKISIKINSITAKEKSKTLKNVHEITSPKHTNIFIKEAFSCLEKSEVSDKMIAFELKIIFSP